MKIIKAGKSCGNEWNKGRKWMRNEETKGRKKNEGINKEEEEKGCGMEESKWWQTDVKMKKLKKEKRMEEWRM